MSSPSPSPVTSIIRWLRLKNYQYEVTFSLYMLTPTEKFIFSKPLLLMTLLETLLTDHSCRFPPPSLNLHAVDRSLHLPPRPRHDNLQPDMVLLGGRSIHNRLPLLRAHRSYSCQRPGPRKCPERPTFVSASFCKRGRPRHGFRDREECC